MTIWIWSMNDWPRPTSEVNQSLTRSAYIRFMIYKFWKFWIFLLIFFNLMKYVSFEILWKFCNFLKSWNWNFFEKFWIFILIFFFFFFFFFLNFKKFFNFLIFSQKPNCVSNLFSSVRVFIVVIVWRMYICCQITH
jgi:hypothetical protein